MNESKVMSLLGFAQKSRKIVSGETGVYHAIKSGKTKLLLIATDSSENTKKAYINQAVNYNLVYKETLTKEQLGQCIGKIHRAALAVTDDGFAKAILDLL